MEELILKEREVKAKIVNVLNESNLPAFILRPIFKDFLEQLSNLEAQQYEQAKKTIEEKEKTEDTENTEEKEEE